MSQHTPTPWEANKQWLYAADGNGNTTRTVPVASAQAEWVTADGGPLRDEAIANAAFIVKAVNSHDALVECVRELLRVYWADGDGQLPGPQCIQNARAALEAAA